MNTERLGKIGSFHGWLPYVHRSGQAHRPGESTQPAFFIAQYANTLAIS